MNKITYEHKICECGKCHCMVCALKEVEAEPNRESFKIFMNNLLSGEKITITK